MNCPTEKSQKENHTVAHGIVSLCKFIYACFSTALSLTFNSCLLIGEEPWKLLSKLTLAI